MPPPDSYRFDLRALHAALEEERARRGINWSRVASETGVAAATLRRTGSGGPMEADGVRAMVEWLGRAPEEFVRARGRPVPEPKPRTAPARGKVRRFDTAALFEALDRERRARDLSWRQLAAEIGGGISPSMLTRLRQGGRIEVGLMTAATGWLGMSIEDCTHDTDR